MDFAARLTKPVLPSSLFDAIVDSLASDANSDGMPPHEPSASAPASALPLAGVRVLLAEDHEINRMVAAELLRRAGCQTTMAVNGREAFEISGREAFDVVLMDCQMPELDGFAATKLIRQRESASSRPVHIPIIALTANAIKGDRELCLAAGMDGYVTKPIEPDELFKAIGQMVKSSGASRRAESHAPRSPEPSPPAGTLPVDFDSLRKRCMGNRELAVKVLESFVSSIGTCVEDLSTTLGNPDMSGAAAAAHKLKGAAANLSAEQVRRLAADLEDRIKSHSANEAQASFNELKIELDRLRDFVSTSLREVALGAKPPGPAPSIKHG
jgi:CheY-like chemotaxis protein/HPt (histidine-containing phosphotransfer) domain-containing protein